MLSLVHSFDKHSGDQNTPCTFCVISMASIKCGALPLSSVPYTSVIQLKILNLLLGNSYTASVIFLIAPVPFKSMACRDKSVWLNFSFPSGHCGCGILNPNVRTETCLIAVQRAMQIVHAYYTSVTLQTLYFEVTEIV